MTDRLNLEQLELTREYQRLTPKQKLFVATYVTGGLADGNYDAVAATLIAYQCKSPEVARIMSYYMLQNIKVVAALNRHFGRTPIEEFLEMLDRAVRNKNISLAQIEALKMQCQLLGYKNRLPSLSRMPRTVLAEVKAEKNVKEPKKPKKNPVEPKPPKPVKSDYGFDS